MAEQQAPQQRASAHSAGSAPRIWPQLPPEVSDRVVHFLTSNDIACGLRQVNKAAAAQLGGPGNTTIHLSLPSPPDTFARRWGNPDAVKSMSTRQQHRLLCLTAASGSIPNLETALASIGRMPEPRGQVMEAAAAARQPGACEWLLQHGCPAVGAAEAAARAGHHDMVAWLLQKDGDRSEARVEPIYAAAEGGHVGLMDKLLQRLSEYDSYLVQPLQLLEAAARGCDLATLQRLHREWLGGPEQEQQQRDAQLQALQDNPFHQQLLEDLQDQQAPGFQQAMQQFLQQDNLPPPPAIEPMLMPRDEKDRARILAAAAGSPTGDWRAKVEWLAGSLHYPRTALACVKAVARQDAPDRLAWLQERGFPLEGDTVDSFTDVARAAASAGNMAALQYLQSQGVQVATTPIAMRAAQSGRLDILTLLIDMPESQVQLDAQLFSFLANEGSVQLLSVLLERGCPMGQGPEAFASAASSGCVELVEWLAARGCNMGVNGQPYVQAAFGNDLAMVRCLQRLGCPWGPPGTVFARVLGCDIFMLRWLLEAGCPVDWAGVEALVRRERPRRMGQVLALLSEMRQRRQQQ